MGGSVSKTPTVVIAVDGSDNSKRAFDWFAGHSASKNTDIVLVHAIHNIPPMPSVPYKTAPPQLIVDTVAEQLEKNRQKAERLEHEFMSACKSRELKCRWQQLESEPSLAIIHVAEDTKADLIVLGTRGQGVIRRTILGSVSHYVIHHCHIPTVLVPPPNKK